MVWDNYLAVGGIPVGNSARAYGYATTADCPVSWLADPECASLADALGDLPYDWSNIEDAPWYDIDNDELSRQFLGMYVLSIENIRDSTRIAQVTERVNSGGRIGGRRYASREVRVRAWLTAQNASAMDYGMMWLSSSLSSGACGRHESRCGVADAEFFTDCPPARGTVPALGDWEVDSRNLFLNPDTQAGTDGIVVFDNTSAPQSVSVAQVGGHSAYTWSGTGTSMKIGNETPINLVAGEVVSAAADFYQEGDGWAYIAFTFYDEAGESISPTYGGPSTTLANGTWATARYTMTPPEGAVSVQVAVVTGETVEGVVCAARRFIVQTGSAVDDYFDGDTVPELPDRQRYSWDSGAAPSISVREIRPETTRPQTDEEYAESVAPYRRFLHDVDCISGPFTTSERVTPSGVVGRLIEFTLVAEDPFIYAVQREVPLNPTLPTVVQDIPYNLVPYPSAEIAGDDVLVATNYSTNPSVESNATDWAAAGSVATVTDGRSTELAAVGSASYRALFDATAAGGSADSYFSVGNTVPLPHAATADDRYSLSMWAARNIQAGAPVFGDLDIRAIWRDGSTLLGTTILGVIDGNSGSLSMRSVTPAVGATSVEMRAVCWVASWDAATIVRLYGDAVAVTVP